jgi:Skp family chaperone for outer membrane proteins
VTGIAFAGSNLVLVPYVGLAQGQPPVGRPAAPAPATQPAAQRGTNVAVIDIKYIFENHIRFKEAMDSIKKDYDAFEAQVRGVEANLRKQIEQLKAMPAGTPEFKQLEQQVATTRTQVQLDINNKQKERVEEEAKVYHNAYQELEAEIAKFAARYGIDLVLQFSSAEIDPAKPDSVIRGLNRLVVYQNQLDITPNILQELNRNAQAKIPSPNAPLPNQPRIGAPPPPRSPVPSSGAPKAGASAPSSGFPSSGFPRTQQK